jgi:hypothetical protein
MSKFCGCSSTVCIIVITFAKCTGMHPAVFTYFIHTIKEDEVDRTCSMHGVGRGVCRVLVGRPEGQRLLGRPRCRWKDNIKTELREIWIGQTGFSWLRIGGLL